MLPLDLLFLNNQKIDLIEIFYELLSHTNKLRKH